MRRCARQSLGTYTVPNRSQAAPHVASAEVVFVLCGLEANFLVTKKKPNAIYKSSNGTREICLYYNTERSSSIPDADWYHTGAVPTTTEPCFLAKRNTTPRTKNTRNAQIQHERNRQIHTIRSPFVQYYCCVPISGSVQRYIHIYIAHGKKAYSVWRTTKSHRASFSLYKPHIHRPFPFHTPHHQTHLPSCFLRCPHHPIARASSPASSPWTYCC